MKILALSDKVEDVIYTNSICDRFAGVDLIISCGDLPNYYLEFVVSSLNKPLFYVMGNHDKNIVYGEDGIRSGFPEGCINLDGRIITYNGLIIMGLEGSLRYSGGNYQYTERQMQFKIFKLWPRLLINRIFKKKYVDIIVTHAPPYKIHDRDDLCHRGFKVFKKLIEKYEPRFLLHGHIHVYGTGKKDTTTVSGRTKIINCYGHKIIEV